MQYPTLTLTDIDMHKLPFTGIFTITPAVAAVILNDRNPHNRKVSSAKVAQTVRDINNGEYVLNGESIIFDTDGNLVDAQHRLNAVTLANKPITSMVVMGMPPSVRESVDQGRARTAGDVLSIEGYQNANTLASVATYMLAYGKGDGKGFSRTGDISNTEKYDWINANPRIHNIVTWAVAHTVSVRGMVAATQLAMTRAILEPIYGRAAVDFLDRIAIGDNISTTHPAFVARKKLREGWAVSKADRNRRMTNLKAVEIMMRAVLAHYRGHSLTRMQLYSELPTINKTARAAKAAAPTASASFMASTAAADALPLL